MVMVERDFRLQPGIRGVLRDVQPPVRLTAREREVLRLVEHGRTNQEIAGRMGIGRPTVARHLSNAMDKLGAESRTHAVVIHGAADAARPVSPEIDPHPIDDEGRAILARLAVGRTLGAIARELNLSRRTADRRLADVRVALGAQRTTEAVALALRLGWLG